MRNTSSSGTLEHSGPNALDQWGVRRRNVLRSTAGGIAGPSLADCLDSTGVGSDSSDDEEPVTIGLLAPHTESDYTGRSMAQAAELAVNERNDNGGIDARPVELVVADTDATSLEARRQYQRLVLQEGANVTMGVFDSPALRTIMNDIAEQETIHLPTEAASATVRELIADEQVDDSHTRLGEAHCGVLPSLNIYCTEYQIFITVKQSS